MTEIQTATRANGKQTTFEANTCGRCGGTGRFGPTCVYGGRCFGCGGTGAKLTKRGAAAAAFYNGLLKKPATELAVGDKILYEGVPGIIAASWYEITEIETSGTVIGIKGANKRDEGYGCVYNVGDLVRVAQTREFKIDAVAQAKAYELTLTKTGTVRKTALRKTPSEPAPAPKPEPRPEPRPEPGATEGQIRLIRTLIDEKNLFASDGHFDRVNAMDKSEYAVYLDGLKQQATTLTKTAAKKWIDKLLALPRKQELAEQQIQAPIATPKIPDGRYALEQQGEAIFLELEIGTRGRWDGFPFLSEIQGDNHRPIKDKAEKARLLEQIAADIEGAVRRYGHYRNECGFCGLGLTDPFSRFYGVGPVCRKNNHLPISRAAYIRANPALELELTAWEAEDIGVAA